MPMFVSQKKCIAKVAARQGREGGSITSVVHAWQEVFKTDPNSNLPFWEKNAPKQEFCVVLHQILPL